MGAEDATVRRVDDGCPDGPGARPAAGRHALAAGLTILLLAAPAAAAPPGDGPSDWRAILDQIGPALPELEPSALASDAGRGVAPATAPASWSPEQRAILTRERERTERLEWEVAARDARIAALTAQVAEAEQSQRRTAAEQTAGREQIEQLRRDLAQAETWASDVAQHLSTRNRDLDGGPAVRAEREAAVEERDAALRERDAARGAGDLARRERDAAVVEREGMRRERDASRLDHEVSRQDIARLERALRTLPSQPAPRPVAFAGFDPALWPLPGPVSLPLPRLDVVDASAVTAPARPPQPAAAAPPRAPRPATADDADRLLGRAEALLARTDIGGARLLLERAADLGDGRAAFRLAQTYDPEILATRFASRLKGDPSRAATLYRRASEAGSAEASAWVTAQGPEPR
ncbi:MAG: hypothetical protein PGN34_08855 [Methylobacterium frigidaeris]